MGNKANKVKVLYFDTHSCARHSRTSYGQCNCVQCDESEHHSVNRVEYPTKAYPTTDPIEAEKMYRES